MRGIYGADGSYAWGLVALAIVTAAAMVYGFNMRRHAVSSPSV
ncbi:MAG TPA: hypothetical protein VEV61_04780 [Streptosporangiaceae bacterium]|nr:hypothetical protein [Streptosporangiaceae bacterium]